MNEKTERDSPYPTWIALFITDYSPPFQKAVTIYNVRLAKSFAPTLQLDVTMSARELAPGAVADALLDGAGARSAAVRRRPDDPPGASTSTESAARAARRPRLPVVGHDAVDR